MVENFSSQKAKYEFSKSKSDQKAIFVTITDDSKRKETPLKKIEWSQDERSRNTPRKSLTFGKLKKQLKQNKIVSFTNTNEYLERWWESFSFRIYF